MSLQGSGPREAPSPIDPMDQQNGRKTIGDVPMNERSMYIKGINGYRMRHTRRGAERPIRYITQTQAYYLLQKPQDRSITGPIESAIVRTFPIRTYGTDSEEMILVVVADEERDAYPNYPILWEESDLRNL